MEPTTSRAAAPRRMGAVHGRRRSAWRPLALWAALWAAVFAGPLTLQARAQASLAAEDIAQDVAVSIAGVKQAFTVVRDALHRNQWYYLPNSCGLHDRSFQGRREPEFTLVLYQFPDPDNPARFLEGGMLRFATTLAVPPEALAQLARAVAEKFPGTRPEEVRLTSMPLKSVRAGLYSPKTGKLIQQGLGSPSGESCSFVMELDRSDSEAVIDGVRQAIGIPTVIESVYTAITPVAGFRLRIDWDQAYRSYSGNEKLCHRAAWFGRVASSSNQGIAQIREDLIGRGVIRVVASEGENVDVSKLVWVAHQTRSSPMRRRNSSDVAAR